MRRESLLGAATKDSPAERWGNAGAPARLGEGIWMCAGAALGLAFYATAGRATVVTAIVAGSLFLLSLRSAPAGFAAALLSTVFTAKIDLCGRWIYSVHVVALVVFAAALVQIARRSRRRVEILALACASGGLALATSFAADAERGAIGAGGTLAAEVVVVLLLARLLHTLLRQTSRSFAWCSSAFFVLLAAATAAVGPTAHSWSLLRYAELWMMTALAASCLRIDQARLLLHLLLLVAATAAAGGVAQHFGFSAAGPFPAGTYARASTTFGQPNPFGGFLAMALAAAFASALLERAGGARFLPFVLLVLSCGLFATLSRGAIVAAAAAVLVLSALARRRGVEFARIGVALALVLAGSAPFWWNGTLAGRWGRLDPAHVMPADRRDGRGNRSAEERASDAGEAGVQLPASGIAQRWIGLRTAITLIRHRPWFGFGPGGYGAAIDRHAPPELDQTYRDNHIHNLYLQIWIESGVFVLAAFLAVLLAFFFESARSLDAAPTLVLAALGIVVAAGMHNLMDVVFVHGIHLLVGFAFAVPLLARR